jgi:hypothetical protein
MPNRIIRAGINRSERVNQLGFAEEVFYRRLLNEVDDHGLFDARPSILRAALFPLRLDRVREADISRWTAICQKAGLIVLYEAGGKQYLKVLDTRWQARSAPKYPLPPENLPSQADENACEQLQTIDNNCSQLAPYSYSDTESNTGANNSTPASKPKPASRPPDEEMRLLVVCCELSPRTMSYPALSKLDTSLEEMRGVNFPFALLPDFRRWWDECDWRGQKGQPPTIEQVRSEWGRFETWRGQSSNVVPITQKKQFCGDCNYGWLPPDESKGETRAKYCPCVAQRQEAKAG